jgi:ADP-heptose:LPS heptosyltransferase
LSTNQIRDFIVVNVGARLREKQLGASDYRAILQTLESIGKSAVLTFGPHEQLLASESADGTQAHLGPATDLVELADLFHRADAVITCDTGPMHLAVAVGSPTCGIFVSTSPQRYGYQTEVHTRIDARDGLEPDHLNTLKQWLSVRPQIA